MQSHLNSLELNAKIIKIEESQGFISAKYNIMLSSLQTTKKQAAAQEKQLTEHGKRLMDVMGEIENVHQENYD